MDLEIVMNDFLETLKPFQRETLTGEHRGAAVDGWKQTMEAFKENGYGSRPANPFPVNSKDADAFSYGMFLAYERIDGRI